MRKIIDRIVSRLLILLMSLMLLQVVWQVFSRYVLSHPSSFTDELSRFLLIWIGLLGAAYVMGQKLHLSITLFPDRLKGRRKTNLEILINFIIFLFSVTVLIAGGMRLVYVTLSLGQTSAALKIPLWFIYSIIPASGVLTCYYCIANIRTITHTHESNGEY